MRRVLVAASLAATASILSGCFGSSEYFTRPCQTSEFVLVSQSMSGALDKVIKTSMPNATLRSVKAKIIEKFDVDKVTMRLETSGITTVAVGSQDMLAEVEERHVINAAKRLRVSYRKVRLLSDITEDVKCYTVTYPGLPKPAVLASQIKFAVSLMGGRIACEGSDGTNDKYTMDLLLPEPNLPVPLPTPDNSPGSLHADLRVTANNMLGPIRWHLDSVTLGSLTTVEGTIVVDGGMATPGGPTDADLDTSSWGACPPLSGGWLPPYTKQRDAFFEPPQHSIYIGTLLQIMKNPIFLEDSRTVNV